jgi:RNA polymerase sigma-70 factor (ECF subfamily)
MAPHPSRRAGALALAGAAPLAHGADTVDEHALLALMREGSESAFETIFHAYYQPLYAFLRTYIDSQAIAEEIVQDLFLWLWARRGQLNVRGELRSYLYSAARNRALGHIRHRGVVERCAATSAGSPQAAGLGAGPQGPEESVLSREMAAAVAHAVARLPRRRREAYTLRWQHELTIPEIARVMEVSAKCVERQLTLATKALRAELATLR